MTEEWIPRECLICWKLKQGGLSKSFYYDDWKTTVSVDRLADNYNIKLKRFNSKI